MQTAMARNIGEIVTPTALKLLFGGCPMDPQLVDELVDGFRSSEPSLRWDQLELDETREVRCRSL